MEGHVIPVVGPHTDIHPLRDFLVKFVDRFKDDVIEDVIRMYEQKCHIRLDDIGENDEKIDNSSKFLNLVYTENDILETAIRLQSVFDEMDLHSTTFGNEAIAIGRHIENEMGKNKALRVYRSTLSTEHVSPFVRTQTDIPRLRVFPIEFVNYFKDDVIEQVIRTYEHFYQIHLDDIGDDDEKIDFKSKFLNLVDTGNDILETAIRLQAVFKEMNLHSTTLPVNNAAEWIGQYIEDEKAYRELYYNEMFIGRERETKMICEMLKGHESVLGIHIWGIGGQGKSCLVKHVCAEMGKNKSWRVTRLPLRTTSNMAEVQTRLSTILDHIRLSATEDNTSQSSDYQKKNALICLDDYDAVISRDLAAFTNLIKSLFEKSKQNVKIRWLFTSRTKLLGRDMKEHRARDFTFDHCLPGLAEFQLLSLSLDAAEEMFRLSSGEQDADEKVVQEIVLSCGLSPQAIQFLAGLVKNGGYTVRKLVLHLQLQGNTVERAFQMSDIIRDSIKTLEPELQKALVKLSVFQTARFDEKAACTILYNETTGKEAERVLRDLHLRHLIECDQETRSKTDTIKRLYFTLHPLVYRYLQEWKKSADLEEELNHAIRNFTDHYEIQIVKIMRKFETNYTKGMTTLQEHDRHLQQYYDFVETKCELLKPYPKEVSSELVLRKKRISDLSRMVLSEVKKRRIFQSEADRAKSSRSDVMQAFWMIEKADVLGTVQDKPNLALDILDELTNGKFAALRGLHPDKFYPALLHALFHKVKGQAFQNKRNYSKALQHLELSVRFMNMHSQRPKYDHLRARIHFILGQHHMETGNLVRAEEQLNTGFRIIDDTETATPAGMGKKKFQSDVVLYFTLIGQCYLLKAQQEKTDLNKKKQYLQHALTTLLDLKINRNFPRENLESYYLKNKVLADIYVEKGMLMEAFVSAEDALSHTRQIAQIPHIKYVISVHQVAKLYMLKGNKLAEEGNTVEAGYSWITSFDYFDELKSHHFIHGSIELDHPMLKQIQQDHVTVTKLANEPGEMENIDKFYKDLYRGAFKEDTAKVLKSFEELLWTCPEMMIKTFGNKGEDFGTRDFIIQRLDPEEEEEARRDSGRGNSSSDVGDSLTSGSGSLSGRFGQLKMEKSLSLEDNVFTVPVSVGLAENGVPTAKPGKKRQRTIDE